jgi:GNAT superfamily N-acetyltransferase
MTAAPIRVEVLTGAALEAALEDVARLRIKVFRDWPYLYDGDLVYERNYLQTYRDSAGAVLVGAFDGNHLIGAATGTPMEDHADDFASAFAARSEDLSQIFYCAESVLLPDYRGHGIGHRFFDLREAHARALGSATSSFCAVIRPTDHPMRPEHARDLGPFWRGRGYQPLEGAVVQYDWTDLGDNQQSSKPLQVWVKDL